MKTRLTTCIILILLTVLLTGCVTGHLFYDLALSSTSDKSIIVQAEHNTIETSGSTSLWTQGAAWLNSVGYTTVQAESFDGLQLHAYIIEHETPSNLWVIAVHGYGGNGLQMASFAQRFYEMGFNVFLPDTRGCGNSEGDYIAMGWHDRLDMVTWINTILQTYGSEVEIALFGISMGGATVMMTAGEDLPSNVKAIVEDCGYSSIYDEFAYQLKSIFALPEFPIMQSSTLVIKKHAGFWLKEGSSVKQVAKSKTPILFIHGEDDTFVPFSMLEEVYQAAPEPKQKLVIAGAGHGQAASKEPDLYWNTVESFLTRYLSL